MKLKTKQKKIFRFDFEMDRENGIDRVYMSYLMKGHLVMIAEQ